MGFKYMWIDALCIVQDDQEDWEQQAWEMDKVYANAIFTIRAVESANCTVPFTGIEAPSSRSDFQGTLLPSWQVRPGQPRMFARKALHGEMNSGSEVLGLQGEDTPLGQCAWAWQERHLSTRCISFYKKAAVWNCNSMFRSECGLEAKQRNDTNSLFDRPDGWMTAVEDYSSRKITRDSDRLPASSGSAARFESKWHDIYVAGFWKRELVLGLGWDDIGDYRKPAISQNSMENNCPTWSWASVSGRINFAANDLGYHSREGTIEEAAVQSINCRPASTNIYGEVQPGGSLTLVAKTIEGYLELDSAGEAVASIPDKLALLPVLLDCGLKTDEVLIDGKMTNVASRRRTPEDLICQVNAGESLRLPVTYALILSGTVFSALVLSKSARFADGYERVAASGIMHRPGVVDHSIWKVDHWSERIFEGAKLSVIKIY